MEGVGHSKTFLSVENILEEISKILGKHDKLNLYVTHANRFTQSGIGSDKGKSGGLGRTGIVK